MSFVQGRNRTDLNAESDQERITADQGTVALAFDLSEHRRVPAQIVDDRTMESVRVMEIDNVMG